MRAVASKIIKPNDRLTSFERLEIYNRQYWFRVLSAFAEDFPGLRAVLGDAASTPGQSISDDCPSPSLTLRNMGSRLEGGCGRHPELGRRAAEPGGRHGSPGMGRYRSLRRSRERSLKPEDLAGGDPALRMRSPAIIQAD